MPRESPGTSRITEGELALGMRTRHFLSLPCRGSEGTLSFKANPHGHDLMRSVVLRVYNSDLTALADRSARPRCLVPELEPDKE